MSENFDYLPHFAQGTVVKGFGRGSTELGIPTANFPESVIGDLPDQFACGVYYGWASLDMFTPTTVYKMVMCVGWNPHYHNKVKTMETHIMHKFDNNFYGENLRIIVLGFIRPMIAFDSLDALITAMNNDIKFAESSLEQPSNFKFRCHPFLFSGEQANQNSSLHSCRVTGVISNTAETKPLKLSSDTADIKGHHNTELKVAEVIAENGHSGSDQEEVHLINRDCCASLSNGDIAKRSNVNALSNGDIAKRSNVNASCSGERCDFNNETTSQSSKNTSVCQCSVTTIHSNGIDSLNTKLNTSSSLLITSSASSSPPSSTASTTGLAISLL